jgi:DnaJ-class molecular chaperone
VKVVAGEGMPLARNPEQCGALCIEFDVQFPAEIALEHKEVLAKVLPTK